MASAPLTSALDWAMDKSLVLGYTRLGPTVRRAWWPPDPPERCLTGRHVLVTGASGGLGLATAGHLAQLGAVVHMGGRSVERLERAREQVLREVPDADVELAPCDVSDLDDVVSFCAGFAARVPRLHALVHNAGVLPPTRTLSPQGHELTLATHVLGPHLMTFGLADILAGSTAVEPTAVEPTAMEPTATGDPVTRPVGAGRVVTVSSGGMYAQPLPRTDLEDERGAYSGVTAYARTKRMQVVLAELWAEHLRAQGTTVASMHPGWADTPGVTESLPRFARVMGPLLRSARSGADTIVWLVASPQKPPSGLFWHDRRPRPTHYAPVRVETADDRERLWDFVRAATGVPAR